MKFWSKFWKLVSKKHLVFGTLLFVVVIVMSMFEAKGKVKVNFDETAVDIVSPKYHMNIPYDIVDHIELMELPDKGEVIKGSDDMSVRTGNWKNEAWGEHYICVNLSSTNCIAVYLEDGRVFVFSRYSNSENARDFETFQNYLNP